MINFFQACNLAKSYWFSEEKWKAWGMLIIIVILNLGMVFINVWLNLWQANFYNVIENYNQQGFLNALAQFSVAAACFLLMAGYAVYLQMMLQISWRRWMTQRYMSNWLENATYYRLNLLQNIGINNPDNPDQRISEDIDLFVHSTLSLSLGLLRSAVSLISFVTVLWQLSGMLRLSLGDYQFILPGYLVWAALGYSLVGTCLTARIGNPLIKLEFNQQRYEADFRFNLMRIRENGESIAFYRGEYQEKINFLERFQKVVNNYWEMMRVNRQLIWFTSGYSQISIIFAILVASPRYFSNLINLGQMFQISNAYGQVHTALSFIIDSFDRIAQWRAVVNRLNQFSASMEKIKRLKNQQKDFLLTYKLQNSLTVRQLSVFTPEGRLLLGNLTLEIKAGDSLLITGPSGCGKSTLLRAMAGIWPFCKGKIIEPKGQKVMFLPQRPYIPLSNLRQILLYPGVSEPGTDQVIQESLRDCQLAFLIDKLNQEADWGQILSNGEQQRLSFVRVVLQKPDWIFLDESTSALDESTEKKMYQLLRQRLPKTAVVSIGHGSNLSDYHAQKLELQGAGNWEIVKLFR